MEVSWMAWCGFCGCIPEEASAFPDVKENAAIFNFGIRCFSLSPHGDYPVCPKCSTVLKCFAEFIDKFDKSQKKLADLRAAHVKSEDENHALRSRIIKTEDNPLEVTEKEIISHDGALYEIFPEAEVEMTVEHDDGEVCDGLAEPSTDDDVEDEEDEDFQVSTSSKRSGTRQMRKRGVKTKKEYASTTAKCSHCNKRFRSEWYLKAHERSHTEMNAGDGECTTLPYSCEECGRRFRFLTALKSHLVVHSDYAPFKCETCGRGFKNVSRLRTHQEMHDEKKFICDICGMQLNTSKSYLGHKRVHSNERIYKCPACPKDFKKNTAFKQHLIGHTSMRPYSCPFCDKTFTKGPSCRHHKVKCHPNELAALEASGNSEEVLAKHRNLPTMEELLARVTPGMKEEENKVMAES